MGVRLSNSSQGASRRWLYPEGGVRTLSTNTVTAGKVYLSLCQVDFHFLVEGMDIYNFATVAGNITVGIYQAVSETTPENAVLIASSASTAMAGANQLQYIAFSSNVYLSPGRYYLAVEYSDNTATNGVSTITGAIIPLIFSYYARGGGYGALIDPCPAPTANGTFSAIAVRVVV